MFTLNWCVRRPTESKAINVHALTPYSVKITLKIAIPHFDYCVSKFETAGDKNMYKMHQVFT